METTLINSSQSSNSINSNRSQNYNPLAHRAGVVHPSNDCCNEYGCNDCCYNDCNDCCIAIVPTTDNYVYKDYKTNFIYVRNHITTIELIVKSINFIVNMVCAGFILNYFIKFNAY